MKVMIEMTALTSGSVGVVITMHTYMTPNIYFSGRGWGVPEVLSTLGTLDSPDTDYPDVSYVESPLLEITELKVVHLDGKITGKYLGSLKIILG